MIMYKEVECSKQLAGCLPLTNRLRDTAAGNRKLSFIKKKNRKKSDPSFDKP